jgi:ligand-binding sensor domain-containing protein
VSRALSIRIRLNGMGKFGRHSIHLPCGLITAVFGLCAGNYGSLLAQDQKIFQMVHTAWTARDGAPQSVNSLAQKSDGMLWLGTRDGLYSFDGLTFSAFHPVSGILPRLNVQSLFATNDGYLWAFGINLRPTRIRDGVATVFDRVDHGTFETLRNVQQRTDGSIWAILNHTELARLGADGAWHVEAKPISKHLTSFFIDSSGTEWLVADNLLYRRAKDHDEFRSTEVPADGYPPRFG